MALPDPPKPLSFISYKEMVDAEQYYIEKYPTFFNTHIEGKFLYNTNNDEHTPQDPNPSTVSNYPNGTLTATELQHIKENSKKMYEKVQEDIEHFCFKNIKVAEEPEKKQKKFNRFQLLRIPKSA